MRRLALAFLLILGAQPVAAQAPDPAQMPPGISHFALDNGLDVVVIEDHRAPVVVQMVWYRIGAADEMPGKSGIAHYLEHLMFKGTDTLAPGEFSKTVTANGGMDNAFTSYDYTAYFQRIAADRLELVMRMEADRMANLRIGEADWQAERQVVLEERAQRTDSDPGALFSEERAAAQYLNHPYGRPVIGWRAEMEGLTRQDALDWYQAHYAPDNAILIVAGDVTPARVRELAQTYYGPIPPAGHDKTRSRPQEPPQRAPRQMEFVDARVAQPVLYRSILAPERNPGEQRKAAALTVLAELLGGSPQTSVLGRELMLTGKAVHVGAYYDGLTVDPTTFTLVVVPADGMSTDEAEAALNAALSRFLETGVDAGQLDRVRAQVHANQIYARDSAHGRAYDYGQGLAIGLGVADVNAWPDLLAEVGADEVEAVARELLTSTATVTGWLLPPQQAAAEGLPAAPEAEAATEPTTEAAPEAEPIPPAVPAPATTTEPATEAAP